MCWRVHSRDMHGTHTWANPIFLQEGIWIQSDLTKLQNNTWKSWDSTEAWTDVTTKEVGLKTPESCCCCLSVTEAISSKFPMASLLPWILCSIPDMRPSSTNQMCPFTWAVKKLYCRPLVEVQWGCTLLFMSFNASIPSKSHIYWKIS